MGHERTPACQLPSSVSPALDRALVSLLGLSVGDAFGERFFMPHAALHSAIDFVATIITWLVVRVSDAPADEEHHYGHGKFESLSALGVTAMLYVLAGGKFGIILKALPFELMMIGGAAAGTFLLANKVQMCTSIDGPEQLHNAQRKLPTTLNAYQAAAKWIKRINEAYIEMGLDPTLYHVEALMTTTKATLSMWKEVVDTYVALGCKTIFLRPIDPFGFAERARLRLEYPRSAYLEFYRNAVDYMLELNRQGVQILERYAGIFLTKILRGEDPNFLDLRSPSGAGIGQLAYNYDGKIFTCDEGRMLHEMGDSRFLLGDVRTSGYRDLVGHETVRAMVLASNLDGQPDCVNCTYKPYCGTISTFNYKNQGSIFGQMRTSAVCSVHKGIQDYLFERLADADPHTLAAFDRWTTIRPREHFVQPGTDP